MSASPSARVIAAHGGKRARVPVGQGQLPLRPTLNPLAGSIQICRLILHGALIALPPPREPSTPRSNMGPSAASRSGVSSILAFPPVSRKRGIAPGRAATGTS